jgi:hypothetical protein
MTFEGLLTKRRSASVTRIIDGRSGGSTANVRRNLMNAHATTILEKIEPELIRRGYTHARQHIITVLTILEKIEPELTKRGYDLAYSEKLGVVVSARSHIQENLPNECSYMDTLIFLNKVRDLVKL